MSDYVNDPRFDGVSEEVLDRVSKVGCARCKEGILDTKSLTGTTLITYQVPGLMVQRRAVLCGACGLAFREFLHPELADDALFQAAVAELRSRW